MPRRWFSLTGGLPGGLSVRRWLEFRHNPAYIRYVRTEDLYLKLFSVDGKAVGFTSETMLSSVYREITDPDHIAALELAYPEA